MDELRCKECGTVLTPGTKECPVCGFPIKEASSEYAPAKAHGRKRINVISIISLFLGVVIIIMGITVINKKVSMDTYRAKRYAADNMAFGADFYTEIYKASDMIVDELNDINSGVELLSESMVAMINAIYYPIGMMIIALGLGVVAISFNYIMKESYNIL